MLMVNVGFGNMVAVQRIVAVVTPESAPIKRMITRAKESDKLIDSTHGRRTRSVIILDSGHIVLSLLQPSTINERAGKEITTDKETET